METHRVRDALIAFAKRYKTELNRLGARKSQLLEIGALAVCADHYRREGYDVTPTNLQKGYFRVKLGSRGYPWNFSWFECERGEEKIEIHANLSVYSAYGEDDGVYVVDVGVARDGAVPRSKPRNVWRGVKNQYVITFAEAKYLVVYPMLLAQFVGIVKEIKPMFLSGCRPERFREDGHFDPALIAVGHLHGTARSIVGAYRARGYFIRIVPAMESKLSGLSEEDDSARSALAQEEMAEEDLPF